MKGWPKGRPHPRDPSWRVTRTPWTRDQWIAAFLTKIDTSSGLFGCWEWTGTVSGGGKQANHYGYVHKEGRMQPAHRAYWETINGPVPSGKELDHLCRNRRCVNPTHLEPVTRLENIMRGDLGASWLQSRGKVGAERST